MVLHNPPPDEITWYRRSPDTNTIEPVPAAEVFDSTPAAWEPMSEHERTVWRYEGRGVEYWAGQSVVTGRWTVEDNDGNVVAEVDTFQEVQRLTASAA